MQVNVASVSAPDHNTVVFKLKKANSRFHALFTVRWNAMWMMPKHVFEKAGEAGQVRLRSAGHARLLQAAQLRYQRQMVHLGEARDWQRTSLAKFGEPGPRYVAYIDPGPPDKRVILQLNHQLDVIHDTSPEGRSRWPSRRPPRMAGSRASPTPIRTRPCRDRSERPACRCSRIPMCAGRWRC